MARPAIQEVMLEIANVLSYRATCSKLRVGCVLVDGFNRIIGSGYNGVPRGMLHCTEVPCEGATAPKGADLCQSVHAEQNALLVCRDPEQVATCYVTHAPCMRCTKLLLNTSCRSIVYHNGDQVERAAQQLWSNSGRSWRHYMA